MHCITNKQNYIILYFYSKMYTVNKYIFNNNNYYYKRTIN